MAQHKSIATATIANGASLSGAINLGEKTLCGIGVPSAWTAAGLSFQASDDSGATWSNVFDSTGAEVTIASAGIVAGQRVLLDPTPFAGIDFLKIRSGTGAAPVNQGGARALTIVSRKVYPLTSLGKAATGGTAPSLPVLVAHSAAQSTDTATAVTPAVDTTGGTFAIVLAADYSANSISVITDSYGNTWHAMSSQTTAGARTTLFYASGLTAGSGHVFTNTAGGYPSICVLVFSGLTALDAQNGATAAAGATTIQPGSVTPAGNGEVIVTGVASNTVALGASLLSLSIDSGFTISDTNPGGATAIGSSFAYLIQTTAAAVNPTWSLAAGGQLASVIGAFK